jgi:hypothetical protein
MRQLKGERSMAGRAARGDRHNQSKHLRGRAVATAVCESLEQRRLLAGITVVVTDPRFAPPGGSRAIANDGLDDAPAIQRAIDYVPQAGNVLLQPNGSNYTVQSGDFVSTVYFPAGVYDFVTPSPTVPSPNLRLKPGINAGNVRTYLGAPGAILRRPFGAGISLDHNSPLMQGTGPDAHDIVIKGLTFEGAGIKLEQALNNGTWCDNVDITGCVFQNVNDGDGLSFMIGVSSGARNCDIVGNTFLNLNCSFGIFALNVENFRVLNNNFDLVKLGMQIGAPSRSDAPGIEVSDNRITRTISEGVQIIPGGGIDPNTGKPNSYNGIYIRRNIVSDFRTVNGIYDGAAFGLEIIGNYSTNMVIENNKVFGKLMSAPPDKVHYRLLPVYGIEVSGDGAIVRNNLIEGFWVPIAGNAFHTPQSDAVIYVQNNRMRGQWWDELTTGVEVRSGTFQLSGNDVTRDVERAVIVGGDLIVEDNAVDIGDDTINVGGSDGAVSVNVNGLAVAGSPFAPTGGILVYGRDGNDSVTIASTLSRPVTLLGGNGNDTLTAGGGASTIYGDAGDDSLVGGAGTDSAVGGYGNDTLAGSDADLLDGGPGNNTIIRNGTSPAAADAYLSDLTPTSASNGWGPYEKDRSNGEVNANDGKTITLNGAPYPKGLGVHANSDLRYTLGGLFKAFTADIGVDDEVGNNGSVIFQVWADGVKLYDSGVMTGSSATQQINVDVSGKNQLQLVVLTNGDPSFDHADWAGAKIWVGAPVTPPPPPPPSGDTLVSDLTPVSFTNGWGPIERNKSNGEVASGDGKTITLNGTTYAKGLGVHANSSVVYNLNGNYAQFLSDIGVDDEVGNSGSVNFQVYLDNVLAYDSGKMTGVSATKSIALDVTGKNQLRLVVTDAGDGMNFDHADWANARLTTTPVTPPPSGGAYVSDLTPTSSTNGWGSFEKDRSNGESAGGDGHAITLNVATYAKGLGVHANSTLTYDLTGKSYSAFTADIGVDDEVGNNGSVIFQVWGDGIKLYDSGLMLGSTATKSINVPITGKSIFSLVVIGGIDGVNFDHADWANAKLA